MCETKEQVDETINKCFENPSFQNKITFAHSLSIKLLEEKLYPLIFEKMGKIELVANLIGNDFIELLYDHNLRRRQEMQICK